MGDMRRLHDDGHFMHSDRGIKSDSIVPGTANRTAPESAHLKLL